MTSMTKNRAFSLIELLVVIAIIALLVGILLPALTNIRASAKLTDTRALIKNIQDSAGQFQLDQSGRMPGLFSQAELGSIPNAGAGLTAMENILLELSAGQGLIGRVDLVDADPAAYGNPDFSQLIKVGIDPASDKQHYVNPKLIGAGGVRLPLDSKYLVAQTNGGTTFGQYSSHVATSLNDGLANVQEPDLDELVSMPDVVDAFGQPLLVWVKDEFGPDAIRTGNAANYAESRDDFVRVEYDETSGDSSWFYLNTNKGYLAANTLGKKLRDQQRVGGLKGSGSALGTGDSSPFNFSTKDEPLDTFMALFGNTSYPDDPKKSAQNDIVPTAARGEIMFHSAGKDGIYFSRGDGGYQAAGAGQGMRFGNAFPAASSTDPEISDLISGFNDLVMIGR